MPLINLTSQITISNGPKFSVSRALEVEAYDLIEVVVPADTTDLEVTLQPGTAGAATFLLVTADWYGAELAYKINTNSADARTLDHPHLFAGSGAVSLVDAAPSSLFFTNSTSSDDAADAHVQILLGRDATP